MDTKQILETVLVMDQGHLQTIHQDQDIIRLTALLSTNIQEIIMDILPQILMEAQTIARSVDLSLPRSIEV